MGTATLEVATGIITYNAPISARGEATFVYRIDLGARTASATVHAYVKPIAQDYSISAVKNVNTAIAVTTRDGAVPGEHHDRRIAPGVTVSGTTINFTPPSAGPTSFSYTYVDSGNLSSYAGTVTATVATYAKPTAPDQTYPKSGTVFYASSAATSFITDVRVDTGNAVDYKVKILSVPTSSDATLTDGTASLGVNSITDKPVNVKVAANKFGTYSYTFAILSPDGTQSSSPASTATVTVVKPTATPLAFNNGNGVAFSKTLTALPVDGWDASRSPTTLRA